MEKSTIRDHDQNLFSAVHFFNQMVNTGFQSSRLHDDTDKAADGNDEYNQICRIHKSVWISHKEVAEAGSLNSYGSSVLYGL